MVARGQQDHEGPDGTRDFEGSVRAVIAAIPPGEVLTYGEVASEAGAPGAARAVGTLLARSGGSLPWWRVVTASGRLVPGHEPEHERRLRAEGIAVHPATGRVRLGAGGARAGAPGAVRAAGGRRRDHAEIGRSTTRPHASDASY